MDGSGNLYVVSQGTNTLYKYTLSGGSYTQSTIAGSLNTPWGVAVDGSGNLYVVSQGSGAVYEETYSGGSYTQSTIASGLSSPYGVAVDSGGNVDFSAAKGDRIRS